MNKGRIYAVNLIKVNMQIPFDEPYDVIQSRKWEHVSTFNLNCALSIRVIKLMAFEDFLIPLYRNIYLERHKDNILIFMSWKVENEILLD